MISVDVIADSISPNDKRITTLLCKYQRFIHSEVKTHRMLSTNSASSRAIPVNKIINRVWNNPATPIYWGKNKAGMMAEEELSGWRKLACEQLWRLAGRTACAYAKMFTLLGLHKQVANRIMEPWFYMETLITATEWGHMLNLRCTPDAQPEFRELAFKIADTLNTHTPKYVKYGRWHLPYVSEDELVKYNIETCKQLSVARCARISYLNHDGTMPNIDKDISRYKILLNSYHMSPFEHQARPLNTNEQSGNFVGWLQYRKTIVGEYIPTCEHINT